MKENLDFNEKLEFLAESAIENIEKVQPLKEVEEFSSESEDINIADCSISFSSCSCSGNCGSNYRLQGCSCSGNCGSNYRKD